MNKRVLLLIIHQSKMRDNPILNVAHVYIKKNQLKNTGRIYSFYVNLCIVPFSSWTSRSSGTSSLSTSTLDLGPWYGYELGKPAPLSSELGNLLTLDEFLEKSSKYVSMEEASTRHRSLQLPLGAKTKEHKQQCQDKEEDFPMRKHTTTNITGT
ncbi:hypothetical protein VNO78_11719 [Psophocarpus tetragonolobus]|uniref:Uncharacterized protein n=1 Tax=Psophocarpus tetragonolobus TaxID=3891 RepID=A0AAN9XNZ5_PSOTE